MATSTPTTDSGADEGVAWVGGSSASGTRGVHRVEGAYTPPAGNIVLVLGGQYSLATDLFETGDENERHAQHITVVWSPIQNLELLLRQSTVSNRNAAFEPATTQNLGDPVFGAKYALELSPGLGVGGGIRVLIPTSARGTGLKPEALVFTGYGAASYAVGPWLAVSLNAGYRLDRSDQIFKRDILPVQRFTAGISASDAIVAGLGADTSFKLGEDMSVGGFAELSLAYALSADSFDESPMRATIGAKFLPFGDNAVEVAVGGDYAIMGTPVANSVMAGIPPWEVFGRVVAHIGPKPKVMTGSGPMLCETDADCTDGRVCVADKKECGYRETKIEQQEVVKEVPVPTFSIKGGVFDQGSGNPLGSASVTFSGVEGSALAVNYETGEFQSWPIPAGEGLIKVAATATGCAPAEAPVQKGKGGDTVEVTLKLQCGELVGNIRGSLKDGRSGKAIKKGVVMIPILNQKIKTDKEGKFEAQVKAGRYQVLISSKKYVTQKKEIEIRAGDTVILNVDMNRGR